MPPPQPRAPTALPNELIEEVLLRVRPDDPASLVRSALACRRWRRLVADPAFRRRRLELHRATPPLLGFLYDDWDGKSPYAHFVPTSSCRPRADHHGLRTFDARHGRVLFHGSDYGDFVVWDPITDQQVELPKLPWCRENGGMKATVLCAANGVCDHLDCHRGPFIVVVVGTEDDIVALDYGDDSFGSEDDDIFRRVPRDMFSCIYSSESGSWSETTYADHPGSGVAWAHSALVGNTLFFVLCSYDTILSYDLGTQQMSTIRLPYVRTDMIVPIQLTTLEDGRLGFARVEKSNELRLWSKSEGDDAQGWTLSKVIDLKDLFPLVHSLYLKIVLLALRKVFVLLLWKCKVVSLLLI